MSDYHWGSMGFVSLCGPLVGMNSKPVPVLSNSWHCFYMKNNKQYIVFKDIPEQQIVFHYNLMLIECITKITILFRSFYFWKLFLKSEKIIKWLKQLSHNAEEGC